MENGFCSLDFHGIMIPLFIKCVLCDQEGKESFEAQRSEDYEPLRASKCLGRMKPRLWKGSLYSITSFLIIDPSNKTDSFWAPGNLNCWLFPFVCLSIRPSVRAFKSPLIWQSKKKLLRMLKYWQDQWRKFKNETLERSFGEKNRDLIKEDW